MVKLRFSSVLPVSYRDELERIVFFNPQQSRFMTPLLAAVNRYGVPTIIEENGCLRLGVPAFESIQTLYALDDEVGATPLLAGVAMFVRESDDTMLVLHLAMHQDYTADGPKADEWVAARLMSTVRDISQRTRGINTIRLLYPREVRFEIGRRSAAGS